MITHATAIAVVVVVAQGDSNDGGNSCAGGDCVLICVCVRSRACVRACDCVSIVAYTPTGYCAADLDHLEGTMAEYVGPTEYAHVIGTMPSSSSSSRSLSQPGDGIEKVVVISTSKRVPVPMLPLVDLATCLQRAKERSRRATDRRRRHEAEHYVVDDEDDEEQDFFGNPFGSEPKCGGAGESGSTSKRQHRRGSRKTRAQRAAEGVHHDDDDDDNERARQRAQRKAQPGAEILDAAYYTRPNQEFDGDANTGRSQRKHRSKSSKNPARPKRSTRNVNNHRSLTIRF